MTKDLSARRRWTPSLVPKESVTLTKPAHANAKDLVLKALSSSEQTGLSASQVAAPKAKVVRDEKLASIAARELVPGDIIEIEAGDNVPADVRLLTSSAMQVEEASLTGESVPFTLSFFEATILTPSQ